MDVRTVIEPLLPDQVFLFEGAVSRARIARPASLGSCCTVVGTTQPLTVGFPELVDPAEAEARGPWFPFFAAIYRAVDEQGGSARWGELATVTRTLDGP